MQGGSDQTIHDVLVFVITAVAVGYGLLSLVRLLARGRPELNIRGPVLFAVALRVAGAAAISFTGFASTLRGGDEDSYLAHSIDLQQAPFISSQWLHSLTHDLHEFVTAVQLRLFDSPSTSLRLVMSAFAVAGFILLAVSVHDLAGPRAGRLAMWLLAIEPSSIFFTGIVNKESLMLFASGLLVFGATRLWTKGRADALIPIALGCAVGLATRVYAGGFMIVAAALLVGYTAFKGRGGPLTSLGLAGVLAVVAIVAVPLAIDASDKESLERNVQVAQDANANDDSNLALEQVDFSTRGAIVTNLPKRVRDILLRPYPWQIGNTSQALGLLGTLVALFIMVMLVREVRARPRALMRYGASFVFPLLMLLVAYSIAVGNAGTGFRYRTQLIALGICLLVVLRERRLGLQTAPAPARPSPERVPMALA